MHLTIHTLPIIRNEIRTYKSLIKERDKLINDYEAPLKTLRNKLLEVEEKLELIKSPGKGDGLGGFVQDSADKYNYLIDKKDQLKKIMNTLDTFFQKELLLLVYLKKIAILLHLILIQLQGYL